MGKGIRAWPVPGIPLPSHPTLCCKRVTIPALCRATGSAASPSSCSQAGSTAGKTNCKGLDTGVGDYKRFVEVSKVDTRVDPIYYVGMGYTRKFTFVT